MNRHLLPASPLQRLSGLGQSVWIDWLSRDLVENGGLQELVDDHAVVGVTTNPTILARAITAEHGYDSQIRTLHDYGYRADRIFGELVADDVRAAAEQLLAVWHATRRRDGYVSWEVDPRYAWDRRATLREVRRLHERIALPNLLVKIPATEQGVDAFEDAIALGYSVNVTLIFSLERYAAVAESYLRGLRRAADAGEDLSKIHSVASLFISRLDTAADELLDGLRSPAATARRGRLGIASAKVAYRHFQAVFSGPRWDALRARGAAPQRLLWASTSSKDPAYRDVRYVENLVGPSTVTTLPRTTLEAFEDHGRVEATLTRDVEEAARTLDDVVALGIDLGRLTNRLERDGVSKFAHAVEAVGEVIESRARRAVAA
jgi:transaldolase